MYVDDWTVNFAPFCFRIAHHALLLYYVALLHFAGVAITWRQVGTIEYTIVMFISQEKKGRYNNSKQQQCFLECHLNGTLMILPRHKVQLFVEAISLHFFFDFFDFFHGNCNELSQQRLSQQRLASQAEPSQAKPSRANRLTQVNIG